MNMPRLHHHSFAHQLLPELAFKHCASFLNLLREKGEGYLKDIWHEFGSTLPIEYRLPADGLTLAFVEDKCFCGVIITLPNAEYQTESHMVGALGERVSGSILSDDVRDFQYRNLRYFTLESIEQNAGENGTVIGEWKYRDYINHGPGCKVDAEKFWESCRKIALSDKRRQFDIEASSIDRRKHRSKLELENKRDSENLLRYSHPAFWWMGRKDD